MRGNSNEKKVQGLRLLLVRVIIHSMVYDRDRDRDHPRVAFFRAYVYKLDINLIYMIDCTTGRIHSPNVSPAKSERTPSLKANTSRRPIRVLKILRAFAWFCSKENRENIDLIIADLKKDTDAMRREKRREIFVQCVLLWHVANTVLPIMWDGFRRLLAAILPVGKIIGTIKGL